MVIEELTVGVVMYIKQGIAAFGWPALRINNARATM
jgi:hypothetical protein